MKKKIFTVADYVDVRDKNLYGKKIRVLESSTHKNLGAWWENASREVKEVKISMKYLFIFV